MPLIWRVNRPQWATSSKTVSCIWPLRAMVSPMASSRAKKGGPSRSGPAPLRRAKKAAAAAAGSTKRGSHSFSPAPVNR